MAPRTSPAEEPDGAKEEYAVPVSRWRVKDLPLRIRPREEIDRVGVENVGDDVLLAILLQSGVRGFSVIELAKELVKDYTSLTALAGASLSELEKTRGIGPAKAKVLKAAFEIARRLAEESVARGRLVKTPEDAAGLLREKARTLDVEVFWVIMLNNRNYVKGKPVEVTRGLIDASLAHSREVFRNAISKGTSAVVLAHNHPSGDPSPSAEDLRITRQLVDAGKVLDIKVLDHVIVGRPSQGREKFFLSMREEGLIDFG